MQTLSSLSELPLVLSGLLSHCQSLMCLSGPDSGPCFGDLVGWGHYCPWFWKEILCLPVIAHSSNTLRKGNLLEKVTSSWSFLTVLRIPSKFCGTPGFSLISLVSSLNSGEAQISPNPSFSWWERNNVGNQKPDARETLAHTHADARLSLTIKFVPTAEL